ncbi:hypothetical protein FHX82_000566 [Amycolatopsis bartoniae]|nr:hypothetical protein [Amycolatopsis bartoniae]
MIDTIGPLLALAPVRKRRIDSVAIVDGTLVPTRDHRLAAPSKNYRYSTNVQIAIDADTRLVIATGDPQPGNRNDCTVYRTSGVTDQLGDQPVMTDGGYQGNAEAIMPFRKPCDGSDLPGWKEELNSIHRTVRARVEHPGPHEVLEDPPRLPAAPPAHSATQCPESLISTTSHSLGNRNASGPNRVCSTNGVSGVVDQ